MERGERRVGSGERGVGVHVFLRLRGNQFKQHKYAGLGKGPYRHAFLNKAERVSLDFGTI